MNPHIRLVEARDLPALTKIYNHYIEETAITFDIEPYTEEGRRPWLEKFSPEGPHRCFVAELDGEACGFASTGLDGTLRNLGIETLVIGGVVTNRCVETTARDATDRGYRVILVDDGTAAFSQELQDMTMLSLMVSHGFVRATEEILALLPS